MSYRDSSRRYASSSSSMASSSRASSSRHDDREPETKWFQKPKDEDDYGVHKYKTTFRKAQRLTFYCSICKIDLNSIETRKSHVDGNQHMMALNARRLGPEDDERIVKEIPNPVALKKKCPTRLRDKVLNAADPVVGLKYITEFIADSDDEMEPYYRCSLCDGEGEANSMFNHLMGRKHRAHFFARHDPERLERFKSMASKELARRANSEAENRFPERIESIRGDETFPWPAGKAPWSIEKGGNGLAPSKALQRGGGVVPVKCEPGERGEERTTLLGMRPALPAVEAMGQVNAETADMFMDFGITVAKRLQEKYESKKPVDRATAVLTGNLVSSVQELAILMEKAAAMGQGQMKSA